MGRGVAKPKNVPKIENDGTITKEFVGTMFSLFVEEINIKEQKIKKLEYEIIELKKNLNY